MPGTGRSRTCCRPGDRLPPPGRRGLVCVAGSSPRFAGGGGRLEVQIGFNCPAAPFPPPSTRPAALLRLSPRPRPARPPSAPRLRGWRRGPVLFRRLPDGRVFGSIFAGPPAGCPPGCAFPSRILAAFGRPPAASTRPAARNYLMVGVKQLAVLFWRLPRLGVFGTDFSSGPARPPPAAASPQGSRPPSTRPARPPPAGRLPFPSTRPAARPGLAAPPGLARAHLGTATARPPASGPSRGGTYAGGLRPG